MTSPYDGMLGALLGIVQETGPIAVLSLVEPAKDWSPWRLMSGDLRVQDGRLVHTETRVLRQSVGEDAIRKAGEILERDGQGIWIYPPLTDTGAALIIRKLAKRGNRMAATVVKLTGPHPVLGKGGNWWD